MLSKGLRDEEKEAIDKALSLLLTWEFIPEKWKLHNREQFNIKLKQLIGFALDELIFIENKNLKETLQEKNFDFDLYEKLADTLQQVIVLEEQKNQPNLAEKIILIYKTAQEESKTFSFNLIQKISATEKYLHL